ncbi:hypothetical protein BH24DEI2_BH24DEI2_00300 [soil metagenome]
MASEQQKVTVTLPKLLLERLDKTVPGRKRSVFITEAIEEHLELIEQSAALEETAGTWSLEHHPTLQDEEGIDNWLKQVRRGWD